MSKNLIKTHRMKTPKIQSSKPELLGLINNRNSHTSDNVDDSGMGVHLLQNPEVRLLLVAHRRKVKTVDDLDQDPLDEDLRHLVAPP